MNPSDKIRNQIKILCEQMPIRQNIVCLLHYGSVKQKEDFNNESDLDFHLVLKNIDAQTLRDIRDIFGFSNKIDLSFHSIDEIVYDNNLIFQNGNQGIYFMHVLASSDTLVGENIYLQLIPKINEEQVRKSIIEKTRYYVWLLRRNYVSENNLKVHKKYFIRIVKDILILEKLIDYSNISTLSNRQVVHLFIEKFQHQLNEHEISLVSNLLNLEEVKNPEIENCLVFFARKINEIVWKDTKKD